MGGEDTMGFLGEFEHNIDQKNRIFIPAKFREALGTSFTLCRAPMEKCIFVYPDEKWAELSREISATSNTLESRQRQRLFFRGSQTVEPDKQGRITIPQRLCDYAGITREVVIFGADTRVELWDRDTFEQAMDEAAALDPVDGADIYY